MTAGRLAAAKPAATTNTSLYRCNIDNTASTVLTATNASGSGVTYRAAIRDYDQILTMNGDEGATTNNLEFAKGNPISTYKLKVTPGIAFADATPGADIVSTSGATAKLLDVFKDTATVMRYVKVEKLLTTETNVDNLIGLLVAGETVTAGTSGLTGTVRAFDNTTGALTLAMPDVASGATSVKVSRNTGLAEGTLLMRSDAPNNVGTEILSINVGGINTTNNTLTVTRGVYGTTASAIPAGDYVKSFIDSATTSTINEGATYAAADATLTLTDATGFLEGSFIRIGNEILQVESVAGNDLGVVRGVYGTSAVDHTDGSAVTQLTDAGDYFLNFLTEAETLTGGTSNATVPANFSQGASSIENRDKFIIAEGSSTGTYEFPLAAGFDNERTYRYIQSDSSNTGHPLRLSEEVDGTQTLTGVEYTTGVTKVGTAGSNGYLEIVVDEATPLSLNIYAEPASANTQDANAQFGHAITVSNNPEYEEIYIYKVAGETFAAADTFDLGGVTYTVQNNGVTPGKYGYVHDWDAARNVLKISLDIGSPAFVVGDTFYDTPTRSNENRYMAEVVAGKIIAFDSVGGADASRSAGTYSVSPTGGSGSGCTVSIVVDGSGAATVTLVNGGKDYVDGETLTATDAVLGGGGGANLTFDINGIGTGDKAGATAETYTNAEDYIAYDKAIAANSVDRTTGIVVGPGQNILVYSSAGDIAYNVTGFESVSDDFTVVVNTKAADSGGGGATP